MLAVVLVNAAPGFEDSVNAALRKMEGVVAVGRVKKENYDLAALIEVSDEAELRLLLDSRIQRMGGVQGAELIDSPSERLIAQLRERA